MQIDQKGRPQLAIVILTFNEERNLPACLASLFAP